MKISIFKIGDTSFGIKLDAINEVIKIPKITQVPTLLNYVKGLINHRGKIFTVIDLSLYFDVRPSEKYNYILTFNNLDISFLLDTIPYTEEIDEATINTDSTLMSNNILGICLDSKKTPIVLIDENIISKIDTTDKL